MRGVGTSSSSSEVVKNEDEDDEESDDDPSSSLSSSSSSSSDEALKLALPFALAFDEDLVADVAVFDFDGVDEEVVVAILEVEATGYVRVQNEEESKISMPVLHV